MITKDKVEKIMSVETNGERHCILTSRYYDRSIAYFMFLFELAKEDFPELEFKDTECQTYGGRDRKGLCGIEFKVKRETMPDGYKELSGQTICTYYPTV